MRERHNTGRETLRVIISQLHSYLATHASTFVPKLSIQPFHSGTFEHERRPITLTPLLPAPQQKPSRRPTPLERETKVLLSTTLNSRQANHTENRERDAGLAYKSGTPLLDQKRGALWSSAIIKFLGDVDHIADFTLGRFARTPGV